MANPDRVAKQIELLHVYHLDLWTELEAQLRVLRVAQEEIGKLRESRVKGETTGAALYSATLLSRHVQTLKGRAHALSGTIDELERTVAELLTLLRGPAE